MNEKILEIKELLKLRKSIEARKKIEELDLDLEKSEKFDKILGEIKTLVRNLGKSNMINKQDLENIIIEYGKK